MWVAGEAADSELLLALAFVGFFLNLFNLIPITPLDGGRAVGALHPVLWFAGLLMMVGIIVVGQTILILIVIVGGLDLWRRWRERGQAAEYYGSRPGSGSASGRLPQPGRGHRARNVGDTERDF